MIGHRLFFEGSTALKVALPSKQGDWLCKNLHGNIPGPEVFITTWVVRVVRVVEDVGKCE